MAPVGRGIEHLLLIRHQRLGKPFGLGVRGGARGLRVRDGEIAQALEFGTRRDVLEAVGLSE
jgi:hypothetical protein